MNTVTIDGMSRASCALTVTLASFHELIKAGLVIGPDPITPEGLAAAKQLKAAGFEFNPGEMEACTEFVFSGGLAADA